MKGYVTITTDAGFLPFHNIGSYAYWIKADGLHLSGSGLFREAQQNAYECEMKAIINALHVLKCNGYNQIKVVIINRDNIRTASARKGTQLERKIYQLLKDIKRGSRIYNFKANEKFCHFRHVKAHTKNVTDRRTKAQVWCDEQCTARLKEWKRNNTAHHE